MYITKSNGKLKKNKNNKMLKLMVYYTDKLRLKHEVKCFKL